MASEESRSLATWYRNKYNLPVNDPRFTGITAEEIALEYEISLALEGAKLKTCFKCGTTSHRTQCPGCGIEISGDALMDDIQQRLEAGENVDLDQALRGEEWQTV